MGRDPETTFLMKKDGTGTPKPLFLMKKKWNRNSGTAFSNKKDGTVIPEPPFHIKEGTGTPEPLFFLNFLIKKRDRNRRIIFFYKKIGR